MVLDSGLLFARLTLAMVFLVAGASKLADRAGSRAMLLDFGLPSSLASFFSVALPVAELGVAVALLPAASAGWGALAALILLGGFSAGIVNLLARGRTAACRCFGQLHSSPVRWTTLARNIVLALIAAFVLLGGRERVTPGFSDWFGNLDRMEWLALFAAVAVFTLLGAGAWFGMQLMRQHGRMLLRLDAMEAALAERGIIPLTAGLPMGDQAPAFEAPNLHGGSTSLHQLLTPGLPVLLVFTSTRCAACTAVLPDIVRWQDPGARLTVALISQGGPGENPNGLAEAGVRHVLVQRSREIAGAFGAATTPSAVLIAPDGTVASSLAEGVLAVRELVSSIVPGPMMKQHLPGAIPLVSFDAG